MGKNRWRTYLFWILLAEMAGALSGWLTREGTAAYERDIVQPPLSPPALVFPIVWAVLYALMVSAPPGSTSPRPALAVPAA